MKFREDGTPISSNSVAMKQGGRPKLSKIEVQQLTRMLDKANEFHLATIREIRYVDDKLNQSKNKCEYRIRCEFGPRHGQEYDSVPCISLFGGNVNFSEIIFSPKEKLLKGNRDAEDQYMFNHDATQVIVAFMDGFKNTPFIIGGWSNTNFDTLTAKRADGIQSIQEFNGLRLLQNDDGEYVLTYWGGKRDTKTKITARPDTAPTTFKIDKNGVWTVDDKENQQIKIDRIARTITITQYAGTKPDETYGTPDVFAPGDIINEVKFDKDAKKVTVVAGSTTAIFDGANDIVTLETVAGGRLKITADKVGIGGSTAELLQQISDFLDKVLTWANDVGAVHLHTGNLGYVTTPPTNASAWTALGTDLTTIKGLVDGIKGGI